MTQKNLALMDVIKETLGIGQTPANAAATVNAAAQGEVVGTAIQSTQTALSIAELVGKRIPNLLSGGVSSASLLKNGRDLFSQYNGKESGIPAGSVSAGTALAAASDLTGLAAAGLTRYAGAAVLAGSSAIVPVALAAGAAIVAATALTVAAVAVGGYTLDVDRQLANLRRVADDWSDYAGDTFIDFALNFGSAINSTENALTTSTQNLGNLLNSLLGIGNAQAADDTLITTLQSKFGAAQTTRSPLILDLDGDGVETVAKAAGNHFDLDGNGFAEMTGWVGKDDGLLVMDRNGNGRIDDGAELFGNNTLLANGQKAANGFEALKTLDANQDGQVNAADVAYANLRVWKDANQNGIAEAGELLTLEQAGVKSLDTGYKNQSLTDAQGNQHRQTGSFMRSDGTTAKLDDVWFAVDNARSLDQNLVDIPADIAALPDLDGFGNVHSLHQAMARDGSGAGRKRGPIGFSAKYHRAFGGWRRQKTVGYSARRLSDQILARTLREAANDGVQRLAA